MTHLHRLLLESYIVAQQWYKEVVLQCCKEVELHSQMDLTDNQHLIEGMMWVVAVGDNLAVEGILAVGGILVVGDTLVVLGAVEAVHLQKKG